MNWASIFRDIEPEVCIRGFSFIFELDAENMAAFVSILHTNLIFRMPDKTVAVELIVLVPYNIQMVVTAGPKTIRS